MIDFMVNIKNKKNMAMCNIKTLIATSVLCVFFNGVLIYGMFDNNLNDQEVRNVDQKKEIQEPYNAEINNKENQEPNNAKINNKEEDTQTNSNTNNFIKIEQNEYNINNQNINNDILKSYKEMNDLIKIKEEDFSETQTKEVIDYDKEMEEALKKNMFLNYKGNFSLLFCFNLCNNKTEDIVEFLNGAKIKNEINQDENEMPFNDNPQYLFINKEHNQFEGQNDSNNKMDNSKDLKNFNVNNFTINLNEKQEKFPKYIE